MTKQDKYTRSARGQPCQARTPGVCNFNPETTVLAHLNGSGMGMKALPIHGAYLCSDCHDLVDGRVRTKEYYSAQLRHYIHLQAVINTQILMIKNGILVL